MLRIRLKRVGRKHDPSFRVVVVPKTSGPTSGKYVENLGSYDPRSDKNTVDAERASYWLSVGAQPSDTVHNLFVAEGIIDDEKINALPKKTPITSDEEDEVSESADEAEEPADDESAEEGEEGSEESADTDDEAEGDEEDEDDEE